MGKFSIRNIFRREKASEPLTIDVGTETDSVPWPYDNKAGGGMALSAVYRCVRLISESVAMLPVSVEKRDRSGIWISKDSALNRLLAVRPNRHQSGFDFWRQTVQQYLCWGNAVIVPMWEAEEEPYELILVSPGCASYDHNSDLYTVNDEINGIFATYRPDRVIHFRNLSGTGRWGVSTIDAAHQVMETAAAGDKETMERFKNGGNVRGFFTSNPSTVAGYNPYSDKAVKSVAESQDRHFRKGGRISYLPGGMQFKELMLNSADMQFLETRKFTVREICRFFGVDPSFVFDDNSTNYKSAEMANVKFLCNTLNPLLVQFEQELAYKLLRSGKQRIRFDREELLCCDLDTRIKLQSQRIAAGLDTPNEARMKDGKLPVAGGDTALVSANLKTLKELTSTTDGKDDKEGDNGNP